ncbi:MULTISPECIES: hypothetical protein [Sphingobacterium]|uniref:hypothetical protein n=1 Tax=Sphingobacterium TaxID=28453 RepID=UPI00257F170D|nr:MULTISPECIES: hypothetical protein [Sphingobacterium]
MTTTTKNNNKETIKLDIPTTLLNELEVIFESEKSKVFKKILFIVYLINQGTWNLKTKQYNSYYELSINHMKGYLSLNKMMSPIINTLIERGVIKKSGIGINGNNYTKYSMIQPFSFSKMDKNDVTTIFLTTEDGAYVNKYINDNYIVKYSVNKANRELKTVEKEVVNIEKVGKILERNNMDLEKEIEILKDMVASMQMQIEQQKEQINQLVNNSINHVVAQPSTVIEEVVNYNQYFEPQYVNDSEGNLVSSSEDVYASTLIERKNIKGADTLFFKNEEVEAENKVDFNIEAFIVPDTNNEIVFNNDVQQVEIKEVKQVEEVTVSEKEATVMRICGRHIKDIKTKKALTKYVMNAECIDVQVIIGNGISGATATRLYNELLQVI